MSVADRKPSVQPVAEPLVPLAPVAASAGADLKTTRRLKGRVDVKSRRSLPQFMVIAGSFVSRANARKLQRQLQQAGYADAFIMSPGAGARLYKVAALGADDRTEIAEALPKINELAGTEAWVMASRR